MALVVLLPLSFGPSTFCSSKTPSAMPHPPVQHLPYPVPHVSIPWAFYPGTLMALHRCSHFDPMSHTISSIKTSYFAFSPSVLPPYADLTTFAYFSQDTDAQDGR